MQVRSPRWATLTTFAMSAGLGEFPGENPKRGQPCISAAITLVKGAFQPGNDSLTLVLDNLSCVPHPLMLRLGHELRYQPASLDASVVSGNAKHFRCLNADRCVSTWANSVLYFLSIDVLVYSLFTASKGGLRRLVDEKQTRIGQGRLNPCIRIINIFAAALP